MKCNVKSKWTSLSNFHSGTLTAMSAPKKWFIVAILLGLIVLATVFLPNWKAIGMIMGIGFDEHSFQPLTLFTDTPTRERVTVESDADRTIQIDIYSTEASKSSKKGMIIYTPFIAGGLDDPQIQRIADTFARLGFTVAVPSKVINGPVVSTDDTEDILATAEYLRASDVYQVTELGFMGLCFGNGPLFAAATSPELQDAVRFVIAFAPYFDFEHAVSYLKTGQYAYGEITGTHEPAPYGVALADEALAYYGLKNVPLDQAFQSPPFVALRKELSPQAHLEQMNFDVYLMHSIDDSFIPYTESLRFADALKDRTTVQLLLSNIFTHEEFRPLTPKNIYHYYAPELWKMYRFASVFLTRHAP